MLRAKQPWCYALCKVQGSFSLISLDCYLKRTRTLPKARPSAGKCYCCVSKGRRREARLSGVAAEGQNGLQEFLSILTYIQHNDNSLMSKVDFTTLKNTTQRGSSEKWQIFYFHWNQKSLPLPQIWIKMCYSTPGKVFCCCFMQGPTRTKRAASSFFIHISHTRYIWGYFSEATERGLNWIKLGSISPSPKDAQICGHTIDLSGWYFFTLEAWVESGLLIDSRSSPQLKGCPGNAGGKWEATVLQELVAVAWSDKKLSHLHRHLEGVSFQRICLW